VGARVIISVGGKKQMQEVVLGDSYGSQSTLRQHFGIGGAAAVDELQVIWPRSGEKQRFLNLAANRVIRITEGSNELVEPNYRRPGAK
jgi:hypothetical protein